MNMDTSPLADRSATLIERVKKLLLKPKEEWAIIDSEKASISGLFLSYIMILAAIPAILQLIFSLIFGYSMLGITYRPPIGTALGTAISQYLLSLVSVAILALVIDALAPHFSAQKNRIQAFKVAAYAATAAWLASGIAQIPGLGFLAIFGIYSLYLLYLGLPLLMKAPADKAVTYTIVVVLVAAVVAMIAGMLVRPLVGLAGGGSPSIAEQVAASGRASGSLSVPGVGTVDLGKFDQAAKRAEKTAKGLKEGTITAVPSEALEAYLPESIGAFRRTATESRSMGMGNVGGSHAEARYESGDDYFELSITDMPAMGSIAALGSAMGVKSERKTETGYQRTHTIDGNLVEEEWNSTTNRGHYSVMFADRFTIKAEGRVPSMQNLTTAIAAAQPDKIAKLAQ